MPSTAAVRLCTKFFPAIPNSPSARCLPGNRLLSRNALIHVNDS